MKRYGSVVAVNGLDLKVLRGECFGLLGPNGAGKTTAIEILEGLLAADAGEVEVLGRRWDRDEAALRARLGIQLQETQLSDKLTVAETLRVFRSFYPRGPSSTGCSRSSGWDRSATRGCRNCRAVRSSVSLSPVRWRANRNCCFSTNRPRDWIRSRGASSGKSWSGFAPTAARFCITTHYMDEAHALCDRVGIMDQGKLIALGTPRELVASLGAEHVVEFALADGSSIADHLFNELPGVRDVRRDAAHLHLSTSELHLTVPALLDFLRQRQAELSQLGTHSATLEDVFVTLTGRQLRDE